MKTAALLMFLFVVVLSGLVIVAGRGEPAIGMVLVEDGPYTFAEREASMFPDGPHWILRGFFQQDPISFSILVIVILFSGTCIFLALHAYITGQQIARMPWIAAAGLMPVWVGICLTFAMLRLLPHYTGQPSYHHDELGAIRVTLFTCLISGLLPAALALFAHWRHSPSRVMNCHE